MPRSSRGDRLKRCVDLAVSASALVILSPVFAGVSLWLDATIAGRTIINLNRRAPVLAPDEFIIAGSELPRRVGSGVAATTRDDQQRHTQHEQG